MSRPRADDARCSWSSEDFVVAFYGEWASSTRELPLRVTSESTKLEHSGRGGTKRNGTLSAGIATYPLDGGTLDAKREGRHRIEI